MCIVHSFAIDEIIDGIKPSRYTIVYRLKHTSAQKLYFIEEQKKKKNTSRQTHVTDCTESILSAGPLSSVTGWFSNIYFVIFSVSIPMKCNRTVDVAYHVSTPHLVCSSSVIFCFYIAISFGHEPQCQRVVHQARPESESFCAYPNAISRATTVMKSFVLIST